MTLAIKCINETIRNQKVSGNDKSTLARDKQDIDRFMPHLGSYKLTDLKPEHFRNLYAELRKHS